MSGFLALKDSRPSSRRSSQCFVRNSHSSKDRKRSHRNVRPKPPERPSTLRKPRIAAILEHEANRLVTRRFRWWVAGSWMSPCPASLGLACPTEFFSTSFLCTAEFEPIDGMLLECWRVDYEDRRRICQCGPRAIVPTMAYPNAPPPAEPCGGAFFRARRLWL
jgi:hypothetical protein